MNLNPLKPRKALNKAFLKVKPNRKDIEAFKANLIQLLDRTNDTESEEFHKNLVRDFLKKTYYEPGHFINTKGRNDLVIHNGEKASSPVGVIIEAKKPTNKSEMVRKEELNAKAFQELVLYYLRERISQGNLEVRHLVITNIHEWFIFDASTFDRLFAQNKKLVQQFTDFEAGRLADTRTDFFYKQIAEPFIASIDSAIDFTYFHLQEYQKPLRNTDKKDDTVLIALFKLLSPEHLLKLPFTNDSNSLDKRFYSELLHIIGLTETKQGGKKLIERNPAGERNSASLLEDAIIELDSLDKLSRLERPSQFGATQEEQLFSVALELCITWINRILFLKLLEAQLISYHKGDTSYAFLNLDKIKNYDDLNGLFFQVLARKHEQRNEDVVQLFEKVPYLNSSLFEPTDMEQDTLFISNLQDDKTLPILSRTVLKDPQGKTRTGRLNTLEYLFEFLNAYDFTSEGSEDIQEENKSLINASVLGLIFEKINGYKDGSFFTPGFITMYMCRETIRKAVVQKFNEAKGWNCTDLEGLYDKIEDREEANAIVNSLKICDPAVGSGHFLVSALNEMISVKNDLRILQDREGKRLKEYQVEVVNDELIVTDEDGELFDYNPRNKERQRIQEALFHEKQTIIENCLFGVDINPNSVKICRLRLWIELLKNAYYLPARQAGKNPTELETLPNIDINIKCGNSLVSRFAIDADLSQALKKSKWSIDSYRVAVDTYRNAESKAQKQEMKRLIADIKSDFRSEIAKNDPKIKRKAQLAGELYNLTMQQSMFDEDPRQKKLRLAKVAKLEENLTKLETEIEEIKANKIFENAFEWRFEFPEVFNDAGDYVGFDVVIGNPPYIRQEELSVVKPYLQNNFKTYAGTADLYVYFVELSMNLLKNDGNFVFIVPNKWMRAGYGKALRNYVKTFDIQELLDFGDLRVFEEATTYPLIIGLAKRNPSEKFNAVNLQTLDFPMGMDRYLKENRIEVLVAGLEAEGWTLMDSKSQKLLMKLKSKGVPLSDYVEGKIYYGIKTGLNEAFVIDRETRERLIAEDPKSAELIKPFLAGRDIKRYQQPRSDKFLILIKNGQTKELFGILDEANAFAKISEIYPAVMDYLTNYRTKAKARFDQGQYWWELRACDYYEEFEKEKIIIPAIVKSASYGFDREGHYSNDKTTIIPTNDLVLLGVMSSTLVDFYLKSIASTKQNGYFEYKPIYIAQLPILKPTNEIREKLENLVSEILESKKQYPNSNISELASEIDQLVYQLYELTGEEIQIVEGN
ncbi:class I SAM-dependent DNA methyltransferase [Cyclobacterium xiamenense]|uniref:class I SAM-dependent DNA methyltransferase n=1 Tax=Cyclobacterium xiamenense TaxID=1297121 RepID=UPI0035D08E96